VEPGKLGGFRRNHEEPKESWRNQEKLEGIRRNQAEPRETRGTMETIRNQNLQK